VTRRDSQNSPGIALETATAAGFDVQPILAEQMLCDLGTIKKPGEPDPVIEKNDGNLGFRQQHRGKIG